MPRLTRPAAKHAWRQPGTARRSCDSVFTRAWYGSQQSRTITDGTIPLIRPAEASGSEVKGTTDLYGGAPARERLGQRPDEQHDHNDRGDHGEAVEEHPE